MVILNSLTGNSNTCVIFKSGSDAYFVSPDCVFFSCLLACFMIFLLKLDMVGNRN